MSRWTYLTAIVDVEGNKQTVRCLTAGERQKYIALGKAIRENKELASAIPAAIVGWGAINPILTDEDVADMPTELLDACVAKIIELSGMGRDDDEKKEQTPDLATTSVLIVESPTS